MLNFKKVLILLSVTLGFVAPASALGFLAEPYAGYEIGNQEQGNTSYDASGINLGFRIGGTNGSILFGLDYSLASFTVDRPGTNKDLKTKDLGAFIGIDLSPVRLWLTYFFDSNGSPENGGDYTGDGGYKLGFGFKAFSEISLNIEKSLRRWKEQDGTKLGTNIEIDGMLISVSLPFTF